MTVVCKDLRRETAAPLLIFVMECDVIVVWWRYMFLSGRHVRLEAIGRK